jgi:PhnB protein
LEGGEEKMAKINPYMGFKGTARQAMEFYKTVFGGELTMSTFGEAGSKDDPAENIMHAMLIIGPEMTLMASDMSETNDSSPRMQVSLSCDVDETEKVQGYWAKLSEGAKISMELQTAPWGDMFGMLTDKFGISWMVNIAGKKS